MPQPRMVELNSTDENVAGNALEMRGISKAFRGVQALNNVELILRQGEIHALMGENGAGKSTLIKVLTGVYPRDSGEIQVDGKAVDPKTPREAETAGISVVHQEINLIPTLSVAENILLGREPVRFGFVNKKTVRAQARSAIARLGLNLDVDRMLASCSIAEQQLVAIARALDVQARILVLDEPTSSLDQREVDFLFQILRQLRSEGMALLFVTHFLGQVYAVSDRITVLRNGALVGEYRAAELPRLKLIGAMLGREFQEMEKVREETSHQHAESGRAILEAEHIGRRGLLEDVSLKVAPGEVVGLGGLLGSGRSETAKILFGIHPADRGELRIEGKNTAIRSPRQAIKRGLAFSSEDRKTEGIVPRLSVRENLILAMQASRGVARLLSRGEQDKLVDHYIKALNIKTASPETPIMNLSGGNQQKVLLARWLAMQPKLIILDEPTRGIDVGAKAEIEKLVQSLRAQGMAVLFISSDLEELARTCPKVTVLRDRRKVGDLEGADVAVDKVMNLIAKTERS